MWSPFMMHEVVNDLVTLKVLPKAKYVKDFIIISAFV